MKSMLRYSVEKLHAAKTWFWETRMSSWRNEKNRGKIGFKFSTLAKWWKWKMLHWLTMRHCVWMRPDTTWWCRGVPCTNNYSPPSSNEEYYTTAPNAKRYTVEHCIGLHISWQVVYVGDRCSCLQQSIE